MKVMMLNGSPNRNGCTAAAVQSIGNKAVRCAVISRSIGASAHSRRLFVRCF